MTGFAYYVPKLWRVKTLPNYTIFSANSEPPYVSTPNGSDTQPLTLPSYLRGGLANMAQ
jgi:hypothetical protein